MGKRIKKHLIWWLRVNKLGYLILLISLFVILGSFNVAPNGEENERLSSEDIQKQYGISGLNADNINEGPPLTITSGTGVLSQNTGNVALSGGNADVSSYSGEITLGDNGGTIKTKSGELYGFGAGGKVVIKDGEVVSIENGNIEIGVIEDNIVQGSGINYDGKSKTLTTAEGGSVEINSKTFSTSSKEEINIKLTNDGPIVTGKSVVVTASNQIIAKFSGKVTFHDNDLVTINDAVYTDYIDGKEYTTYTAKNTALRKDLELINGVVQSKCDKSSISCIERDSTGQYMVLVAKNNIKMEVNNHDGSIRQPIVPAIQDKSTIKFSSTNQDGTIKLLFSKDPMKIIKGDLSQHNMKIMTSYFNPDVEGGCCTQVYGSAHQINGLCLSIGFNNQIRQMYGKYQARLKSPLGVGDFYGGQSQFSKLTRWPMIKTTDSKGKQKWVVDKNELKVLRTGSKQEFNEIARFGRGLALTQPQAVVFTKLCGRSSGRCYKEIDGKKYSAYEIYKEVQKVKGKISKISDGVAYANLRLKGQSSQDAVGNLDSEVEKLKVEYTKYMREQGYWGINDIDEKIKRSSCIGSVTLPLKRTYLESGQPADVINELWTPHTIGGHKQSGKAYGVPLARNVQQKHGWEAIYVNPDAENPEDMRWYKDRRGRSLAYGQEHIATAKQNEYYGVEINERLVNYAPTRLQRQQQVKGDSGTSYPVLFGNNNEIDQAKKDAESLKKGAISLEDAFRKYSLKKYHFGKKFEPRLKEETIKVLENMKPRVQEDLSVYNRLLNDPNFQSGFAVAKGGVHNFNVVKEINPRTNKPELYVVEEHFGSGPTSSYQFEKTPLRAYNGYGSYIIMVPPIS